MGLMERVIVSLAARSAARFDRAAADPVRAQLAVFRELVGRAADTEWGRRYGYRELRSPETFRERVPLADYEVMAPLWRRAAEGARDVTWPGSVRFFAVSSGTTSGEKFLPVTRDAIRSNRRSGAYLLGLLVRHGGVGSVAGGKFFYLGGSTTLQPMGRGFYGDASGIMARRVPFFVRRRYLPDRDIAALTNWEEKIRLIVARHLTADVCALSACPSWGALLFKEMREEAARRGLGTRTVGDLWPGLSWFISFGMSFEPYRRAFAEYIGRPVRCRETYSSSEGGMTAIQEEEGGPLGLIVDNGVFYEFIPAGESDRAEPRRLHLGEVEEGRDYELVLSANGGLWAYRLGDAIRFESIRPPRIVFAGRTRLNLNAFGEHVTLEMIEKGVSAACAATGATVADYTVAPTYPGPDHPRPAHRWIVEFDRAPRDDAEFMRVADRTLRGLSADYDAHRTGDFGMEPPALVRVAPGTFYAWMKEKGKLGGQHKVPRVACTEQMVGEILALSAGGSRAG